MVGQFLVPSTRVDAVPPVAVPKPRDDDNSTGNTTLAVVAVAFCEIEAVINNPFDMFQQVRMRLFEH